MHIAYSNSFGDAVAYGNYWLQYADRDRLRRKPPLHYLWYSFTERLPGWGFIHPYKQAGKPLLLYEVNCYRTDKFRAEFPLLHALCGSWQDLDGIFFYQWDYAFGRGEENLAIDRLHYPTTDHGWHGVTTYSDQIFLASAFTSGRIFRLRLLKPPENPTVVRYGSKDLNDIRQHWYGALHRVSPTVFLYGLRITFDPSAEGTTIVGKTIEEKQWKGRRWQLGDELLWDAEQGSVILDLPTSKACAGFLPPEVQFKDGVKVRGIRKLWFDADDIMKNDREVSTYRPYYCFTMVSDNGVPLARSSRVIITLVSTSQNTV